MRNYTTVQGDTWDIISYKMYGSELFTDKLIQQNFKQRDVSIFGAGVSLDIPDVTPLELQSTNLPPWRRG